jgi:hypothetical protein
MQYVDTLSPGALEITAFDFRGERKVTTRLNLQLPQRSQKISESDVTGCMLELNFTGPFSCLVKVEHNSCFVDVISVYQMSLLFNRSKFAVVANAHHSLRL